MGDGKVNSWYHSGSSINSKSRASQKSGRSVGERRVCCLLVLVTTRVKGKRHVYLKSLSLNLSRRGRNALWFLRENLREVLEEHDIFPIKDNVIVSTHFSHNVLFKRVILQTDYIPQRSSIRTSGSKNPVSSNKVYF